MGWLLRGETVDISTALVTVRPRRHTSTAQGESTGPSSRAFSSTSRLTFRVFGADRIVKRHRLASKNSPPSQTAFHRLSDFMRRSSDQFWL